MYLRLFFVYSGAVFAPLVFYPDPNRDPNAEKSGGFIPTGKDTAAIFSERKGAEMTRNVHEKYPTNLRDQAASGSNPDTPTKSG